MPELLLTFPSYICFSRVKCISYKALATQCSYLIIPSLALENYCDIKISLCSNFISDNALLTQCIIQIRALRARLYSSIYSYYIFCTLFSE